MAGPDPADDLRGGMRVPDLSKMARLARDAQEEIPLDEVPPEALLAVQAQEGMVCYGCERRITVGFEFVRFAAQKTERGRAVRTERSYACSRGDCDYAPRAARDSFAMKPVEWAYLDEVPEVGDASDPRGEE